MKKPSQSWWTGKEPAFKRLTDEERREIDHQLQQQKRDLAARIHARVTAQEPQSNEAGD